MSSDKSSKTPEDVFKECIQYVVDAKHLDLLRHTPHKILCIRLDSLVETLKGTLHLVKSLGSTILIFELI